VRRVSSITSAALRAPALTARAISVAQAEVGSIAILSPVLKP
jgi:hypothetical protein